MAQMNLQNRNRSIDMENRLAVDKGEGRGRGMDWEFGIGKFKLLYTEWIHSKVLLHSSRKSIQFTVINHNGKNIFFKCVIYMCITKSFCCTAEIDTTLRINYITIKNK